MQVVPGELSIVTGVPNSGKSEWIDALLCNLAEQCGWSFAMCSMEKKARAHALLLRGGSAHDAAPMHYRPFTGPLLICTCGSLLVGLLLTRVPHCCRSKIMHVSCLRSTSVSPSLQRNTLGPSSAWSLKRCKRACRGLTSAST